MRGDEHVPRHEAIKVRHVLDSLDRERGGLRSAPPALLVKLSPVFLDHVGRRFPLDTGQNFGGCPAPAVRQQWTR